MHREELEQERSDIKFYRKILPLGENHQILIFDVGANVGEKTRIFLKLGYKRSEVHKELYNKINSYIFKKENR